MHLFYCNSQNESNNDSKSVEKDNHKENDSDKEYKTRKYITKSYNNSRNQRNFKRKIIFKYLLNKKFKEDSIQSPNLRGEIEYKNTVKKASKIVKISYTFGMKDNLDCNKIESFNINGKSNKTVLQDSSQNFQCVIEGNKDVNRVVNFVPQLKIFTISLSFKIFLLDYFSTVQDILHLKTILFQLMIKKSLHKGSEIKK